LTDRFAIEYLIVFAKVFVGEADASRRFGIENLNPCRWNVLVFVGLADPEVDIVRVIWIAR
jgi:hypothetical protein